MKVDFKNPDGKIIRGELVSSLDYITTFVPEKNPYNEDRITIKESKVAFYGKEDDNVIMIKGYVFKGNRQYQEELLSFYPV